MVVGGGGNVVGATLVVEVVDDVGLVAAAVVEAPVADALDAAVVASFVLAGVLSSLHEATSNVTDIAPMHNRQRRRGSARHDVGSHRVIGDRSSLPCGFGRDAVAATIHDRNVPQQSLARTCSGPSCTALDR
jgi:hypothetical protein